MLAEFFVASVMFACLYWTRRESVNIPWYLFRCCLCESLISFKDCSSVLPFSRNTLAHKLLANQKDLLVLCVSLKSLFRDLELGRNLYLLSPALSLLAVTYSAIISSSRMLCCASVLLAPLLNVMKVAEKCFVVLKKQEVSIEIVLWGRGGRWRIILLNDNGKLICRML